MFCHSGALHPFLGRRFHRYVRDVDADAAADVIIMLSILFSRHLEVFGAGAGVNFCIHHSISEHHARLLMLHGLHYLQCEDTG
jgi:hypothetical protein